MSQIYRSERQNFTRTKPNYYTEWQGFMGTSHSCRLKTSQSNDFVSSLKLKLKRVAVSHRLVSTALPTTPFEL